jgi:exodeoxyribonuclease VII large subunit
MPGSAKSQWNFGELFGAEQTRKVFTVTELTQRVKRLIETQIGVAWVAGEISNFRAQSSGHIYFTLKDAGAQLACVLFRGEPGIQRELLRDGQQVLLRGDLTVYEARGQHQLVVREVELRGVGALQQAFERLKQKLQAEGLFAAERKRPLPRLVLRIGVVTSPTAAAWRDVLTVIRRRSAGMELVLAPSKVQGDGAAAEIAQAIRDLNQYSAALPPAEQLQAILITRGGGSLEDLWAFNEEVVARAVFESALPVVSAVGHEIDFTISDFVADLRAPTPSAAAELLSEGMFSVQSWLPEAAGRLQRTVRRRLDQDREIQGHLLARLKQCHPRLRLENYSQRLDDLQESLGRAAHQRLREGRARWQNLAAQLGRVKPSQILARRAEHFGQLQRRLLELTRRHLAERQARMESLEARLRLLSPEQTLARGYAITTDDSTGRILRRAADTRPGQRLNTRLHEGQVKSVVSEKSL